MEENDMMAQYTQSRQGLNELAKTLSADDEAKPVAPCPGWNVHDVFAHLTGICADIVADNVAEVGTDPWTAAQVQARKSKPLPEIIDEWSSLADQTVKIVSGWPDFLQAALLGDVVSHEQDIRGAIGKPANRDSAALKLGLEGYVAELGPRLDGEKLPALRVVTPEKEWTAGEGEPAATVKLSSFELLRSLTGRRSAAQVKGYEWEGNPEPYLVAWSNYGELASSDVVEA